MKKVVLVLLVFILASNALAYDYFKSVTNGHWRSGSTWNKGTKPIDCTDIAEIIDGYTVHLDTKFTSTTTATVQIRRIYVGKNSNGTLDLQAGAMLKAKETYVGWANDGVQWTTGQMFVRAGATYYANDGFGTGKTHVGDGAGSKGYLDIAGKWMAGDNKPTNGLVTIIGGNNADLGVLTVRGGADIDLLGGFTTSGSNSVLAFRGAADFDVTDQVVIADGTIFDLESNIALGGATTIDLIRSATGITINLGAVTVVGTGTLSLNGNTLQMTVPEPMTIALLGLGGLLVRRRK